MCITHARRAGLGCTPSRLLSNDRSRGRAPAGACIGFASARAITVCAIAGTNFAPYLKLLGPDGLDIPFSVLIDSDPRGADGSPLAHRRLRALIPLVGRASLAKAATEAEVRAAARGRRTRRPARRRPAIARPSR